MKRIPTVVSLSIASPNVFALVKFFYICSSLELIELILSGDNRPRVEFSFDNQNLLITH